MDHDCIGPLCKECKLARLGITTKEKAPRKRRNIRNASKEQERNLGHRYEASGFPDARRVPGSGSIAILPGDIDPGKWFLGEAKETRTGKMTVEPEWYDKIEAQAKQMGRPWWVLHTWTATETGRFRKLVTLPEDEFFEILRRLNAAEKELEERANETMH